MIVSRSIVIAIFASTAAVAQTPAGGGQSPEAMSCAEMGLEITELTSSAVGTSLNVAETATKFRNNSTSVATAVGTQALGMALGSTAGGRMAVAGIEQAMRQAEEAKNRQLTAEMNRNIAAMQANEGNLERLMKLHELYEAKCPQ